MPVKFPEFSEWIHWSNLNKHSNLLGKPGVYLLAHFDNPPSGPADPYMNNIVYVGESQLPLCKRLNKFQESANSGKFGHSGGRGYHSKFKRIRPNLHIAIANLDDGKKTYESIRSDIVKEIASAHLGNPEFIRKRR